jgi:hypothetical protein
MEIIIEEPEALSFYLKEHDNSQLHSHPWAQPSQRHYIYKVFYALRIKTALAQLVERRTVV